MKTRAEHHPRRVYRMAHQRLWKHGMPWGNRTPGPRQLITKVYEFFIRNPDGFYRMPLNPGSTAAHESRWDKCPGGNACPGPYKRVWLVEGKAVPRRPRVIKRYKP